MTVLDVIHGGAAFLRDKDVESPRLQAELLLAHVLNLPRMRLYLEFDRVVAPPDVDRVRVLIKRRANREPLQYIVGTTSFCGIELFVDARAMIPRPETELLAERACDLLAARSGAGTRRQTVVDFGTGTGCIAIALAAKFSAIEIHALDVCQEALKLAAENAARNHVTDRIHFHHGDGLSVLGGAIQSDLIVANPPYIPTGGIAALAPEVRDHEPRRALDGGDDGLKFYRQLAFEARLCLQAGGRFLAEFGDGQADSVRQILEEQKWVVECVVPDYSRRPRFFVAATSKSES